mmetsp:Transcript_5777/g.12015  ORF Transcript_5777/g.12015 Transcript_5777/m.12015 type:complete len:94 (+) Transcript_5777:1329-1610(+)
MLAPGGLNCFRQGGFLYLILGNRRQQSCFRFWAIFYVAHKRSPRTLATKDAGFHGNIEYAQLLRRDEPRCVVSCQHSRLGLGGPPALAALDIH